MPYYVYVLQCQDGSFYTGYTKNVDSRVRLHKNGQGARYTRIHKPKKLVYVEELATRAGAMKRERGIKRLKHEQKKKLARTQAKLKRRPAQ